jgi:PKD domain
VKATDRHGASGTAQVTVTVTNAAPTVRAAADPKSGTAPLRVRLSAAGSDPDGGPLAYVWDFGDGQKAGGAAVTHTYTAPGTYTATVTARDIGGKTATASVTVTVAALSQRAVVPPGAASPQGAVQGERAASLVRKIRRSGRRVRITIAVPKAGRLVLSPRLKAGGKTLRQKARRLTVRGRRTMTVTLRLSRRLERALARRRSGRLTVRVAFVAKQGGERTTQSRTLKLRAP